MTAFQHPIPEQSYADAQQNRVIAGVRCAVILRHLLYANQIPRAHLQHVEEILREARTTGLLPDLNAAKVQRESNIIGEPRDEAVRAALKAREANEAANRG